MQHPLDELRAGTAALHRTLDREPPLRELLQPSLSLERYILILRWLRDVHAALEARLIPHLSGFPGSGRHAWRYRWREPLLRSDLQALGSDPGEARPVSAVPALTSPETVWGVLYVLEGATQGGRVIAPALERSLGIGRDDGAGFFALHQYNDWVSFRDLAAMQLSADELAPAILAAQQTFHCLHRHLGACMADCPGECLAHRQPR